MCFRNTENAYKTLFIIARIKLQTRLFGEPRREKFAATSLIEHFAQYDLANTLLSFAYGSEKVQRLSI